MATGGPFTKKLWTELNTIKNYTRDNNLRNGKFFFENNLHYDVGDEEDSSAEYIISGKLWPTSNIYKDHALQIEIHLPPTYPAEPPKVKIDDLIYHPNVDDRGRLSADSLSKSGTWKATTTLMELLAIIVDAIDKPSIDKPMNADAAKEYKQDRTQYEKKAIEKIVKTGKRRS